MVGHGTLDPDIAPETVVSHHSTIDSLADAIRLIEYDYYIETPDLLHSSILPLLYVE